MSHDPQEFQVPVIFDVSAYSREEAGAAVVAILDGHQIAGNIEREALIDSWWTLEQVDKAHDRNDRDAGAVVFGDDLDYLHAVLRDALTMTGRNDSPVSQRIQRLTAYFAPEARVATPDDRDADGY